MAGVTCLQSTARGPSGRPRRGTGCPLRRRHEGPRRRAAAPRAGPDFAGSRAAAVLGVYAGNDDRVNASRDTARAAL